MNKVNNLIVDLNKFKNRPNTLQVAVYGKYNHGKSSLLNVLVHKDIFKVADIRETVEIKRFNSNNITWIDTPGLDADIRRGDDDEAHKILTESDCLLFVHSVAEGELDNKEREFLKDRYKFNQNIAIILTQIDQVKDIDEIRIKIRNQLNFAIKPMSIIAVSSTRAKHANHNIQQKSNIEELNRLIIKEQKSFLENRDKEIEKKKRVIKQEIRTQKDKLYEKKDRVNQEITTLKKELDSDIQNIKNLF